MNDKMIQSYNENRGQQFPFDVVIPTDEKNSKFVGTVVTHVRRRMPEAGTIYIVTKRILFDKIKRYVHDDDWQLIDENTMVAGLSFSEVFGYLKKKGCDSVNKVGWYFQQFLKLAFALTSYCKGYYLTWDSDTLPISELHFFQDGQPLFTMKKEYHRPYFNTLQRLIGLDKTSSKSFIAEHMIFKPEFVCEMIEEISQNTLPGKNWVEKIIQACDFDYEEHCFSEFETYGTFCTVRYPGYYGEQTLNTFRAGSLIRGRYVNDFIIERLSSDVDIASFAIYDAMFPYDLEKRIYIWKSRWKRLTNLSPSQALGLIWRRIFKK